MATRKGNSYIDGHFTRYVDQISERRSGEVLGERISYAIRKGWVERALIALSGFPASPKICGRSFDGRQLIDGGQATSTDLVMNVLVPINPIGGSRMTINDIFRHSWFATSALCRSLSCTSSRSYR